ncbi:nucleoside-diphosphate-sugar epimerase [Idiomarina sp. A28L]|uniref:NAD-dependent epimerase/dehydratase family protein n=1 Tax=Idiomarina sp. A28L TaxID=1036674 RepID=UPI0002138C49|nr:NAD(P)-dependent oxidoreductase [Idiomarina sp. A28L]EGN74606.1 nucleoside-diphosphate-sugar epimerase [Idiomarina sp. A28L]
MKILIIGGRGFIGQKLVDSLVKHSYAFDVLSRSPVETVNPVPKFIKGDLLAADLDFDRLVSKYDVIFNCAGELYNKDLMYALHVDATAQLVSACKKNAKKQNRKVHWVQLSSVGAYGPSKPKANKKRLVTEETTPAPIGEYEVTKTLADEIILKAADEFFSYTILRPSNVFGAQMPNSSIRQLAAVIKRELFFYIGKPGSTSNYVHVDDVVDALVLCGFDARARDQVFNLSNDCPQSDVIDALAEGQGLSAPKCRLNESVARVIAFLFSWFPGFPLKASRIDALVNRTNYDISKIERVVGFKPSRDVKNTIMEALE